jgi:CheY-like chemotaxis protein
LSRRVLVVDDEPDVREIAVASLEAMAGWQVSTAASGVEALKRAAEEKPEAINICGPG